MTLGEHRPVGQQSKLVGSGQCSLDLRHTDLRARVGVAGLPHRNGNRQFAISGIGVVAPQVAVNPDARWIGPVAPWSNAHAAPGCPS